MRILFCRSIILLLRHLEKQRDFGLGEGGRYMGKPGLIYMNTVTNIWKTAHTFRYTQVCLNCIGAVLVLCVLYLLCTEAWFGETRRLERPWGKRFKYRGISKPGNIYISRLDLKTESLNSRLLKLGEEDKTIVRNLGH